MSSEEDKFAVLKTWPVEKWDWPKVVLFTPITPALPFADDVIFNFFEILQGGVPFFKLPYTIPDAARNKAAQALRESEYTHVLMLDFDHPHPGDIVQRLCRRVIEDPERLVVAAIAYRRGEPYDPMIWKYVDGQLYSITDWEHGSIFEVDIIATPAMLIHRSVFEKISYPWFYYAYTEDFNEGRPTEDVGFCKKVRSAGIQIWCDSSVQTPHMKSAQVTEETYRTWCQMHPEEQSDPVIAKKAVAIAERLGLTEEQLIAKVRLASANVKAAWEKANPKSQDDVEQFYVGEGEEYFYDLLNWNSSPFYRSIIAPLHEVKGKEVMVIGSGIGGEIDPLLDGDNAIFVHDLPGALFDFVKEYYEAKVFPVSYSEDFGNAVYDLIVAVDVIEHLHPAALPGFLDDILNALNEDGSLYIHTNFVQQDIYPMHYAENKVIYDAWLNANFENSGKFSFKKLPVKVAV